MFLFPEINKCVNVVVAGVTFTEWDIIWVVLPKQKGKPIYKITKQGTDVWKKTQYESLVREKSGL